MTQMDTEKQFDQLVRITAQQGEQISALAANYKTLEKGLNTLSTSVQELTRSFHKPVNFTAWISITISAIVLAAVYLEARFDPVEKLAERAVNWTDARDALLQEDYVVWGSQLAKNEHNFERVHELSEEVDKVSERVAVIEGAWPLMLKQLDAVDSGGSRRWVSQTAREE